MQRDTAVCLLVKQHECLRKDDGTIVNINSTRNIEFRLGMNLHVILAQSSNPLMSSLKK